MEPLGVSRRIQRTLEIIPGTLVWGTFVCAVIFSLFAPVWVIYFIILFDLYWLFRVAYFILFLLIGWRAYHASARIDWQKRLEQEKLAWPDILHCIILPMTKEDVSIVHATLEALLNTRYPAKKFLVVLTGEERMHDHFQSVAVEISKRYANSFGHLLITEHPDGLPDEIASKGANNHYAGKKAQEWIDRERVPYDRVIVSAFDIDTIVHPDYFSCLTHAYLSQENPTRCSYQPVVLYNNNIWSAPSPMRLAAFSTTFWLLTELARPDRLFTFSSHSMSFAALVDVGFWQKNIVSEDSRIFLQCFFRYHGEYRVVPLYVPVSMDTVLAPTVKRSLVNLYKQQRRWALGVEHFPYMVVNFWKDRLIPLRKKIKFLVIQIEGMYTWATAPILIFFLGRLPLVFAPPAVEQTVLAQNLQRILEVLMNISMGGVLIIGFLSFFLLPPQPGAPKRSRYITMAFQWVLLPITIIVFSALPALDAQTRLMLGRYLGFAVTEKTRREIS